MDVNTAWWLGHRAVQGYLYYKQAQNIYNQANHFGEMYNKSKYGKRKRSMSRGKSVKRSRPYSVRARGGSSGKGVTAQYDAKTVYRKKSMPKYKKRIWKKFVKKVQAVNEKENGTATMVFNNGSVLASAYSGLLREKMPFPGELDYITRLQGVTAIHLYGGARGNGSATEYNQGVNDLSDLFTRWDWHGQSTVKFNNPSTKLKFTSACLDTTFTNTHGGPLEVDVYHIVYRKNWNNDLVEDATIIGNSTYGDYMGQYSLNGTNRQVNDGIFSGGPAVDDFFPRLRLEQRGVTPFELGHSISALGMKIVKKTKYFTSPNQSFTVQIRDPKTHMINNADYNSGSGGVWMRGITQTLLFIVKPTIEATGDFTWSLGSSRVYKIQKTDDPDDSNSLFNYVKVEPTPP